MMFILISSLWMLNWGWRSSNNASHPHTTSDYKLTLFNTLVFTYLFFGIEKKKNSHSTKHCSVHLKHLFPNKVRVEILTLKVLLSLEKYKDNMSDQYRNDWGKFENAWEAERYQLSLISISHHFHSWSSMAQSRLPAQNICIIKWIQ